MAAELIDSSALHADRDRSDANHGRARAYLRRPGARFHTTSEIHWEAYTLARRRLGYEPAMEMARALLRSSVITVHRLTADEEDAIWSVLAEMRGVGLSHADASLIVLARRLRVRDVFSFDADFVAAGLTTVP